MTGNSIQPRKQRLADYNKNYNQRNRAMAAHLNDDLLKEYSRTRSVTVRKGDTVKVVRGAFRGQVAKVVKSFPARGLISIEEATLTKADGKKVARMFRPSNVVITKLDLSDPWRREKLNKFKAPGRAERREEEREEKKETAREEKEERKEKAAAEKEEKEEAGEPESRGAGNDEEKPAQAPVHKPEHAAEHNVKAQGAGHMAQGTKEQGAGHKAQEHAPEHAPEHSTDRKASEKPASTPVHKESHSKEESK